MTNCIIKADGVLWNYHIIKMQVLAKNILSQSSQSIFFKNIILVIGNELHVIIMLLYMGVSSESNHYFPTKGRPKFEGVI